MWRIGNVSAAVVIVFSLAYLLLRGSLTITPAWWLVDVAAAGLMLVSAYRRRLTSVPDAEEPGHLRTGH